MSYIRTKNGVYEVLNKETDICVLTNRSWVYKFEIIKQADTIKEMTDYFFHLTYNVDTHSYIINYFGKVEELDEYLKNYKQDLMLGIGIGSDKIFFALSTYLGLKYVARMNEKGELELL